MFDTIAKLSHWGKLLAILPGGLDSVMSYTAAQRRHKTGVQMALGASRSQATELVLRAGLRLTLTGLALGITGALALVHWLTSMLYEVRPTDPPTFAGMSISRDVIALFASAVSARPAA